MRVEAPLAGGLHNFADQGKAFESDLASFLRYPSEAGARHERTLAAVACTPMFGPVLVQGPRETVPDTLPFSVVANVS